MWAAGVLAALSSITYPSISSFVSILADKDKQGTVQGVITGIRGLCQGVSCPFLPRIPVSGFGPALFGLVFYIFDVNLDDESAHIGVHFPPVRIRPVPVNEKILSPRRNETVWVSASPPFNLIKFSRISRRLIGNWCLVLPSSSGPCSSSSPSSVMPTCRRLPPEANTYVGNCPSH